MKQDAEKLRKKVANMSREISIRDAKIKQMNTQLQAQMDLIIALKNTWAKQENRVEEMTKLLEEHCPEVLKSKQVEWRQKSSVVGVLRT